MRLAGPLLKLISKNPAGPIPKGILISKKPAGPILKGFQKTSFTYFKGTKQQAGPLLKRISKKPAGPLLKGPAGVRFYLQERGKSKQVFPLLKEKGDYNM